MQLLLARSPHFPPGMHSALAGFVEPGESLEECLVREVREEVGVEVTNLRYFSSQPWPFPHSLMIAFNCDCAGGEITPDPSEIEAADWFDAGQSARTSEQDQHRASADRRDYRADKSRHTGELTPTTTIRSQGRRQC